MGFSNQERINLNSKVLAASVKDANEVSQWYESFFTNKFILTGDKVWTDPDLGTLLGLPAQNLSIAQSNAASNSSIIQDLSAASSAIRLTEVPGTNGSTYAAFSTYNDLSSSRLENWIQPQLIPRTDAGFEGYPSIGYTIRLYDGDPNAGGTEITTSEGQTGSGVNASVGWVFDYANGLLLLSSDFRGSVSDPWIVGFRYVGTTAGSGGGSGSIVVQNQESAPVTTFGQTAFTLNNQPLEDGYVQMYINGLKQEYGTDYTVTGMSVTYTGSVPANLDTSDVVEFWYLSDASVDLGQQQESIPVTFLGQTSFTLSDTPVEDGYVQMFVNGLKQEYGIDYFGNGNIITYTGSNPSQLDTTDIVEFWYLANLNGASGSSGGELSVGTDNFNVSDGSGGWNSTSWSTTSGDELTHSGGTGSISAESLNILTTVGSLGISSGSHFILTATSSGNNISLQADGSENAIFGPTSGFSSPEPLRVNNYYFPVPVNQSDTNTFLLPENDGEDGYVLTTDGYGNLTFEPGAANETLAQTLASGNVTGGNDIQISNGDVLKSVLGSDLNIETEDVGSGSSDGINISTGNGITGVGPIQLQGGNATTGRGGNLNFLAGNSVSNDGGSLIFYAGDSESDNGGNITMYGGDGSNNIFGGNIRFVSGAGSTAATNSNSGNIELETGDAKGTGDSGDIRLRVGDVQSGSNADGGFIGLEAGYGDGSGSGGEIFFIAGDSENASAGGMSLAAGTSTGSGNAGLVSIRSGNATGTGNAGSFSLTGGNANSGGSGRGSSISINAGNGGTNPGGEGGNVFISSGAGNEDGEIWLSTQPNGYIVINSSKVSTRDLTFGITNDIIFGTGNNTNGSTGTVSIASGDATSGDSGDIDLAPGSATGTQGIVNILSDGYVSGSFTITDKLTVGGLIDPTGMVFDIQSSVPGGTPDPGKATLWIRDSDGYAILTDENGVDTVLSSNGSSNNTDGYTGGGEYWVDGINGNDNNDGSELLPFASLNKAFEVIGPVIEKDTIIHLLPTSDVNGYSGFELFKSRTYIGLLKIIGEGSNDITPNLTLDSFGIGYVYDFSTEAPGFIVDGYIGRHLEFVSGTSGITPGTKTTIVSNGSDTVIGSSFMYAPTSYNVPTAGDVFKVTTPGAVIAIADEDKLFGGFDKIREPSYPQEDEYKGVLFRNIEFRAPNNSNMDFHITGRVHMEACTFSKDDQGSNDLDIYLTNGSLNSGLNWGVANEALLYFGAIISGYDRTSNNRLPKIKIIDSIFMGGICAGQTTFDTGSIGMIFCSSRFDMEGLGSGFPHGCLYVGKNSHVFTNTDPENRIYFNDNERDIEVEFGMIEMYVPCIHEGSGGFLRSRHQGQAIIARDIINNGSDAEVNAWEGGRIRLIGSNFSNIGDAVVGPGGSIFTTTRPAGAWSVGEILKSGDGAVITRTS